MACVSERTELAQPDATDDTVELDIAVWERIMNDLGHTTDAQRARALRMNHGVISRIRKGTARPGRKFVARTLSLGIPFAAVFRAVPEQRHGN